jgi:hypothetical protein
LEHPTTSNSGCDLMLLVDDRAACPHQPTAEAANRDLEKFREQGGQRHALISSALRQHLNHR